jgi:hypothetical protein
VSIVAAEGRHLSRKVCPSFQPSAVEFQQSS